MTGSEYMGEVARLPCCICLCGPVHVHHCIMGRFSQARSSDFDTIPLCPVHHQFSPAALHSEIKWWRERYGRDTAFIPQTRRMVLGPSWQLWRVADDHLVLERAE